MKAQHKKRRFFQLLLIPVLLLSTFVLLTPDTASAAQYKDLNLEAKARSYTYYRAMVSCVGGLKNDIKADANYDGMRTDPANGYWYGTGDSGNPDRKGDWWSGDARNEAEVTPKSSSVDGLLGCTAITKTALKDYWNEVTPADFLKAMNYKWDGNEKWVYQGDNGKNKEQRLKDFLSKQGVSTEYTLEVEYFVNFNAFVNSKYCKAKDNGLLADQSQSIQNRYKEFNQAYSAYEGKTVYKTVTVATDTKPTSKAFTYTGNPDHPAGLSGAYTLYYDNYKTCDEMAANISKTAGQYTLTSQKNACAAKGYSGARLNACVEGAANKGTADYCNKFTDATTKEACVAGTGVSIGDIPTEQELTTDPAAEEGGSSCVIPGVGWIICPVVSFMADIADNAFGFLADSFLQVDVEVVSSTSGTSQAWAIMRNLANVAFVICFLIIIFSQLTGQGIANYGIKKMLPRLIIAAILVNVSFFICQLAVDLSNIVGFSIKSFFDSIGGGLGAAAYQPGNESGNWLGIATAVLAGGGIAWALGLSVLLPFLLGAVIALVMVFVILVVRQMLIILLIVIAPLAFVAFLLPNTEQLFKRWQKMFVALLMVFPIIGLLFGAAGLASKILEQVYAGTGNVIGQIVAAGVLVLPLFLLPSLLKGSLSAIPAIGNKLSGMTDRLSKGGRARAGNSGVMKSLASRKARTRAQIGAGIYDGKNPVGKLRSRINSGLNKSAAYNAVTGDYGTIRGANINKLEDDETKLAEAAIQLKARSGRDADGVAQQFSSAIAKGDIATAKAAQNILMRQGGSGVKAVRNAIETHDSAMGAGMRAGLSSNIAENHGQAAKVKSSDLLSWATGGGTGSMSQISADPSTWSGLSARDLVDHTDPAFERALASGGVSAETIAALNSERMRESLTDEKRAALDKYSARASAAGTAAPVAAPANNPGQGTPPTTQQPATVPPVQTAGVQSPNAADPSQQQGGLQVARGAQDVHQAAREQAAREAGNQNGQSGTPPPTS